jgi:hypothetical protein
MVLQRVTAILGAVLAIAMVSCGGGSATPENDVVSDQGSQDFDVIEDILPDNRPPRDLADGEPRYKIIIHGKVDTPRSLLLGQRLEIDATVVDFATDGPADGVPLAFEIVAIHDAMEQIVDDGDGALERDQVSTDDQGNASNSFLSGTIDGRIYTVELTIPDTDTQPVSVRIQTTSAGCGCVEVVLQYDGVQPKTSLKDIVVSLVPADYQCRVHLRMNTELDDEIVIRQALAQDLNTPVRFNCVDAGQAYSVYVRTKGQVDTCVATWGCSRTLPLHEDVCDRIVIGLEDAELNPSGIYDAVDHFDFSNVVEACAGGDTTIVGCATSAGDTGKTICCALNELTKFFQNPGLTVVETFQDILSMYLGSLIASIIDLFKDAVANVLTDYIKNRTPPWMQDFFTIGESMLGIITNLELQSTLELAKPQKYTVAGTHYWTGMVLYWKIGCNPGDPGFDQCGRIELSAEDLAGSDIPLNTLRGDFTANIANFNKLIIFQHEIRLNYGKLVLYVLNDIVIAAITDGKAHSLTEVAHLWIDCPGIAKGIKDALGGAAPANIEKEIENGCKVAVDSVFGFATNYLDALSLSTTMMMSGTGTLVDDNCDSDLKVDRIINGVYDGFLQGSAQQAIITGSFEAVRR